MTKSNKLNSIDLDKIKKPSKLSKVMYIRTSKEVSQWMQDNQVSPTKLFNQAAEVLMKQNGSSGKSKTVSV